MYRKIVTLLTVATSAIAAGDDTNMETAADAKLIQGKWSITKYEKNGKPGAEQIGAIVEFTDTKMTVMLKGDDKEEANYSIDATKTPKRLDVKINRGDRTKIAPSIYELNGDMLKICFNENSDERPPSFDVREGDAFELLVLERIKPRKPQQ